MGQEQSDCVGQLPTDGQTCTTLSQLRQQFVLWGLDNERWGVFMDFGETASFCGQLSYGCHLYSPENYGISPYGRILRLLGNVLVDDHYYYAMKTCGNGMAQICDKELFRGFRDLIYCTKKDAQKQFFSQSEAAVPSSESSAHPQNGFAQPSSTDN